MEDQEFVRLEGWLAADAELLQRVLYGLLAAVVQEAPGEPDEGQVAADDQGVGLSVLDRAIEMMVIASIRDIILFLARDVWGHKARLGRASCPRWGRFWSRGHYGIALT